MNNGFLLFTWCDENEVAISIGQRHGQGFLFGYLMWWKGSRDFYWSRAWTVVSYWLPIVIERKSRFLLVASTNCGFLLVTPWCDGKEGRDFYWSHVWAVVSYWLPDVMERKSLFLLVKCINCDFLLAIPDVKGSRDFNWSQAWRGVSYWLPDVDVTGGKPFFFLLVAGMSRGFLLVTWYNVKEVAVSIGRRHAVSFGCWLTERKSWFLLVASTNCGVLLVTWCGRGKLRFPLVQARIMVSYWLPDVMERKSRFLLVAGINSGFLLVTWCDGQKVAISIGQSHELWFPIGYLM